MSDCNFSIKVMWLNRGLEWRPEISPISAVPPTPMGYSSWELEVLRVMLKEFEAWLEKQAA